MNIETDFVSKLQKKVLDAIKTNHLIETGEGVVCGISGGPDSVCLLHMLRSLRDILDIKLYAVHINHMLRDEEADLDEEYTAGLCKEFDIPLCIVRTDAAAAADKLGTSIEEAGREIRYSEFNKYANNVGASKIAVAHNRNDQAETVMMHIMRGTGTAGLSGMDYRRDNIIRPLLDISRCEIEQYCSQAGLTPRTDSSNLAQEYTRNKVRLGLFPYISEKFGVNIIDSLCRMSENASIDERFMEKCAAEAFEVVLCEKETGSILMDIKQLRLLDPAVCVRVLKQAVKHAASSIKGVGSVHYQTLMELIMKGGTGSQAELPGGIRAVVSYDLLRIYSEKFIDRKHHSSAEFSFPLEIPGITAVPELDSEIAATVEMPKNIDKYGIVGYNPNVQYFDYDKLNKGINIRNRRSGDTFKPLKSNGTKKLKKYFIDSKIPREKRGMVPLIALGDEIVWIIGYKISDKFKVTENTKRVLKIEYNRRGHHDER